MFKLNEGANGVSIAIYAQKHRVQASIYLLRLTCVPISGLKLLRVTFWALRSGRSQASIVIENLPARFAGLSRPWMTVWFGVRPTTKAAMGLR